MQAQGRKSGWILMGCFVILFGCNQNEMQKLEEDVVIASSVFYPRDNASGVVNHSSDGGSIPGGGVNSNGGGNDGGSIPGSGGSGGGAGSGTSSSGGSGSGGIASSSGSTSSGSGVGSTGSTAQGGSDSGSSGTSSGATPGGSDSGSVSNTPSSGVSGNDTGAVGANGSGSAGSSTANSGSSSSGSTPNSGTGNSAGVGNNGTSKNGTSASNGSSGSDGGVVQTNPGSGSSGNDGGSVSGNVAGNSGSSSGGSGSGNPSSSGNTNTGGGSSGPLGTTAGSSSSGSTGASGSAGGGNTASNGGSDGGSVPGGGGSGNPNGGDGGSVGNGGGGAGSGSNSGSNGSGQSIVDRIKDLLTQLRDYLRGNDGGSMGNSGHPPGGGADQGSVPDKMILGLGRVCSVMRSRTRQAFIEDAKNPIFTLELMHPNCRGRKDHLATAGMVPVQCGKVSVKPFVGANLVSRSLSEADLLKGPWATELDLSHLSQFQRDNTDKTAWVIASACDDSNGDGKCSDEHPLNILSVGRLTFPIHRVPKGIKMDVWTGRHMSLIRNPEVCEKQYSPLVLDLTGEGIKLSGPGKGIWFDINDTGRPVNTGWVASKNAALLVRDLNVNGKIDSGAELFGSATRLSGGQRAQNGFEALRDLDSNQNSLFDPQDQEWSRVKLWLDHNFNGHSEKGEFRGLNRMGVESINLNYIQMMEIDPFGNQTRQRSTFRRVIHGKSRPLLIIDVWFNSLVDWLG